VAFASLSQAGVARAAAEVVEAADVGCLQSPYCWGAIWCFCFHLEMPVCR